jgi:AraC family transcriptional regulator, transcriptional activator of pobA
MQATENFAPVPLQIINGNLPFEISPIQRLCENKESFFNKPQSNNNFKVIWIIKGSGIHYVDLHKSIVEDNCLFLVKPRQVHQLNLIGPAEGYVISFAESFLSIEDQESNSSYHTSLFRLFSAMKGISVRHDVIDMKNIADKMMKEYDSQNLFRAEILRRYFKILLIYITRQLDGKFETVRSTRNMELVQQFMGLLEKNYKEQKMVADYAGMLCVTPNYLNEIVKKTTGFSAGHHIRQRIVLEAKRQATYSGNCMKEIAYFLGFGDMAHFSKFFKNTTGMNFSEFKKEKLIFSEAVSFAN